MVFVLLDTLNMTLSFHSCTNSIKTYYWYWICPTATIAYFYSL